ncbi:DNA-binding Lrp family transcriptional regulator [Aequitasia blattaphilus]|uniref:Lrp/AsnC family transcriptional regulator n=1 Tax=Aequitasia blattaphilus TaxID=2949332 RepID=A0ABT1EFH2_9FIRM|nr:Lrp/AsnC family transcriptional regulator [Aequitasia blattaphilus]MCP1103207.1 Lrp/AsnC family transcriptional regulator [Aequitasia blattaphilus]MCR8615847.1 Lrp/AsnC family transcriptional regulator [Aequitasia blattaphilus]
MLIKLLALLDEGRAYSQLELAELCGTREESVKAQMEYLERAGFLRRVTSGSSCESCGGKCSGSTGGCGKDTSRGVAMWEKTLL